MSSAGAAHPSAADAQRVIGLIDLTDLDDDHDPDGLRELVDRALEHHVPAVCVWPEFVGTIADSLAAEVVRDRSDGARCLIATVVNFPAGRDSVADVVALTRDALAAGADEIDLVLPYRDLMAGDAQAPRTMIETVRDVVHAHAGRTAGRCELKVILETGELETSELIAAASRLAIDAGADFIKSSTGKSPVSATLDAFAIMVDAVAAADRTVGLKPSGGIRTVAEALGYLDVVDRRLGPQWATPATFRFGASSLLDDAIAVALTA